MSQKPILDGQMVDDMQHVPLDLHARSSIISHTLDHPICMHLDIIISSSQSPPILVSNKYSENARLPLHNRRRYRLIQILCQQRPSNMNNLPLLPQLQNPPQSFVQPPLPQDHHPMSWIEIGLMGRGLVFNSTINGQESVILIQNPRYLAQLVAGGLHLAMSNYWNHVSVNNILQPLVP